jgi:hypothetical protein
MVPKALKRAMMVTKLKNTQAMPQAWMHLNWVPQFGYIHPKRIFFLIKILISLHLKTFWLVVSTSCCVVLHFEENLHVPWFWFFKKNWKFFGCVFKPRVLPILKSYDSRPNTFFSNSRTFGGLVQIAMASTSMPLLFLMASPSFPFISRRLVLVIPYQSLSLAYHLSPSSTISPSFF